MNCIKCGKEIPEGSLFCNWCGKKQTVTKRRQTKRCSGDGSITKVSGRKKPWWARTNGIDGERHSLGYFATKAEAAKAIEDSQSAPDRRFYTLGEIYEFFVNCNYFQLLSKSGQASHKNAWAHLSSLSGLKMREITTEDFQHIVDNLAEQGKKRATLEKVRNLASLLCKEAARRGIMTTNYGSLVQLPHADGEGARSYSKEEISKIWAAWKEGNETAGYVTLLTFTGMRPNEPRDITIGDVHEGYFIAGRKTKKGMNRVIPFPSFLNEVIEHFADGRESGMLFNIPKYSNWRQRKFVPLMEELGIKGVTPNSSRHTYSDIQKRRNIPPEIMMDIMGHEDYSTTVEHYHSVTEEDISIICSAAEGLTIE